MCPSIGSHLQRNWTSCCTHVQKCGWSACPPGRCQTQITDAQISIPAVAYWKVCWSWPSRYNLVKPAFESATPTQRGSSSRHAKWFVSNAFQALELNVECRSSTLDHPQWVITILNLSCVTFLQETFRVYELFPFLQGPANCAVGMCLIEALASVRKLCEPNKTSVPRPQTTTEGCNEFYGHRHPLHIVDLSKVIISSMKLPQWSCHTFPDGRNINLCHFFNSDQN